MNFIKKFRYLVLFFTVILLNNCATFKAQYAEKNAVKNIEKEKNKLNSDKKIAHTFYLIGDAGNSDLGKISPALKYLNKHIVTAPKNSTLLFLGDNVYETGIPSKKSKKYPLAKHRIKVQTDIAEKFAGNSIFIPGNHDWYNGLDGLKREEKLVEKALGKNSFLPENGCPLKKVSISKDVVLIIVDTHWYVTNWDNHPKINDKCDIKTRKKFFDEFKGLIKKARGKTTIIALHHPMFTNGSHGGYYSFKSHLSPLPVLGTLKNILRKTTGIANVDLQNKKYNELKKHITTLAQENDKTIFVSGHEHSLQYIVEDNLPQIISGSGSKSSATKLTGGAKFTYGSQGFAQLDIYKDGSSNVRFYSVNEHKVVYQTSIFPADKNKKFITYPYRNITKKSVSIYSDKEVKKTKAFEYFWGKRYRKDFGTKVTAPTVNLDTLFGGLRPVRKGGGNQSKSLRLRDKKGREYVMRALRKNAVQYLQAVAFKDQYLKDQFDKTYTESLLLDAFTGSHPYAPFTIGTLAKAAGIYHTNPVLYYIPKQNALGSFNAEFGDELYMIEERAASGHGDKASFGFSDKIISTDDLLKKLAKSEKHILDEPAYIKARLFDMLIGDWDRHEDQWRWAVFKENGQTIYRPVPRDRDQAFSIMGDGFLLNIATRIIPTLRLMKAYKDDLKSPKWFNLEPYPLDMSLISQSDKKVWDAQVKHIAATITDEIIAEAFNHFPEEVQGKTIKIIKKKLQGRRKNLQKISDTYFSHINKFQVIKGTNKDDWFEINRLPNGQTKVTAYRIKKGEKGAVFHQRTYKHSKTKEIWIYGLDDDDVFVVKGNGDKLIKLRIIGGQNNDNYDIRNGKKVKIYDYKSKKNTFITNKGRKKLTDDYEINTYNYKKLKNNANVLVPIIGANPDDGFKIGVSNTYTINGFERNPFTAQHKISGAYYFATDGFELNYSNEFANIIGNWNLGFNALYTSPNYAKNFFGFGNNSINLEADNFKNKDYNRVKISKLIAGSSVHWKSDLDAILKLGINYQSFKIDKTSGRFITSQEVNFNHQNFFNTQASYHFENTDNTAFTTTGMKTALQIGYTYNLENKNSFAYTIPSISFDYKLIPSGTIVLATKFKGHLIFGNDFEFYQGASLGANNGLRGYRNERFTGKNAFYHSTDIRLNLTTLKTSLIPLYIGIYGGFDYGKVWMKNMNSDTWNTSIGGGIFFNAANMMTAKASAFNSHEGLQIAFALGFNF
ncbi:metallophosphoesterase [Tenacibaculum finnmarkense]|uniref:metallophosphoesterase n=1 Tax=Tenacibaculum finnmarkense TaxID=2781243 RepID=UPI001E650148|nr:metallophosphoesterase [Tenacibaculum finnmarkense]MCD8403054.1 phosphoesterase [Tenacibaculum finnmarkense genomovar finnmarkense]